jgi:hypothetical protein
LFSGEVHFNPFDRCAILDVFQQRNAYQTVLLLSEACNLHDRWKAVCVIAAGGSKDDKTPSDGEYVAFALP